ncbi:MAG: sugar phosphate nucleotidyltransferase [Candidatus Omnitrophota bacterium]
MKGIVLAGGLGKRLFPLTKITNKHLLPIYDKPMIYYPIMTLLDAGIKDIMIVTGGDHAGNFLRLLGNGYEFGLKGINYAYQEKEGGIAEALALAEHFAEKEKVVVILGDNIIEKSIKKQVKEFDKQPKGARILIKKVNDPQRFGVVEFKGNKISKVTEKPRKPKTDYIVTGIYMYDHHVFDIIKTLRPSKRGETEITGVNNAYIKKGQLEYSELEGWWTDAGTFESLLRANNLVAEKEQKKTTDFS